MAKNIDESVEFMNNLTPEAIELFIKKEEEDQKKAMELAKEQEEYIQKLLNYKLQTKELINTVGSLTRKEIKSLRKKKIDIMKYTFQTTNIDERDKFLDSILDLKGLTDVADDLKIGELIMWLELIIVATLEPIIYEGNA
jgi:hypothetical protein